MIRIAFLFLVALNFIAGTVVMIIGATHIAQSPIEGILLLILGITLFATGYLFTNIIDYIDNTP